MGPGDNRGLAASGGALLMAVIVAIVVLLMVQVGGGRTRPLIASPHKGAATTAQASTPGSAQSQG